MRRAALVMAVSAAAAACELQEVVVADVEEVVVAEVFVTLREPPGAHTVRALLHGADEGAPPDSRAFDDALVRVTRTDGLTIDLAIEPLEECVGTAPGGATGTCFVADSALAAQLEPGDALALSITLGSGGTALAALTLPGPFALTALGEACRLPPDTPLEVIWSRSSGAWAYINETVIEGLPDALAPEGIEAEDSLYLLGLSISAEDTTVVFPGEFGIFDRFDLDQDLAVRLQRGLPDQTSATVSIAAVERNYVNWARGGNFNPSGLVRISSLRGSAVGVFGGAIADELRVIASAEPVGGVPDCP